MKAHAGKILDGNCSPVGSQLQGTASANFTTLKTLGTQLRNFTLAAFVPQATTCKKVNPTYSYFRIPIWNKKGGGIRVKRLLMYNKGIDVNDPGLYGTEYIYENEKNHESYGVATNEPFENKEENPLVTIMEKREEQSDWDRLFSGKDKDQFEGPYGYNALPSASVGYSRIIKKNIHQTKSTGGGYTVADYYTVKDYPFDRQYQTLENGSGGANQTPIQTNQDAWSFDVGLFKYSIATGIQTSQGYCFIQNQMHGQLKSIADYPGQYNVDKFNSAIYQPIPVAQTAYTYFEPGEQIPMYDYNSYTTYFDQPGKETDITIERRSVREESEETRLTGDLTYAYYGATLMVFPIAFPITSESDQHINTMVVNKMIHYPSIIKNVTVRKGEQVVRTENTGFDPLTGKPVVTKTYDGYNDLYLAGSSQKWNGTYTSYDVPASSQYSEMGQKSWNERYCYRAIPAIIPTGSTSQASFAIPVNGIFQEGDMVALHNATGVVIGHVTGVSPSNIDVIPDGRFTTPITPTIPLVPYSKIEVLKSTYTNQLSHSSGGLIEYGAPIVTTSNLIPALNDAMTQLIPAATGASVTLDLSNLSPKIALMSVYTNPSNAHSTCFNNHYVRQLKLTKQANGDVWVEFTHYDYWIDVWKIPASYIAATAPIVTAPKGFGFFQNTSCCIDLGYNTISPAPAVLYPYLTSRPVHQSLFHDMGPCTGITQKNVIKANVIKYEKLWPVPSPYSAALNTLLNPYEIGERGMWRESEEYVYRVVTRPGSNTQGGQRNYNMAGTQTLNMIKWIFTPLVNPENWVKTRMVTQYSPNGDAVEEQDANLIYSAAKYGYRGFLPYAIAQNSQYGAMRFESFENLYAGNKVEDNVPVPANSIQSWTRHTGRSSCAFGSGVKLTFDNVTSTDKGHLIKFWIRGNANNNPATVTATYLSNSVSVPVNFITRTGEWSLFEAFFNLTPNPQTTIKFDITSTAPGDKQIDDIRIQPFESQMTAYVYDVGTYKISATLDDQNFATYYQYNGEGKLTRKFIETEQGVQPAGEAHYHSPTVPR